MKRLFLFVFLFACCFGGKTATAEPTRSTAWLGFPIVHVDQLPKQIDLTRPQSLGSAFLLQLRRQAVLIAARDELGAITRDAFLDETAPKNAVQVPDVAEFPDADPKYVDHQQFLIDVEKLSRNEFVTEWHKLGLEQAEPSPLGNADFETERKGIEKLLGSWALIPQFEAVRRTHKAIRQNGESLPLLTQLVRGYTQLQMLTNTAPRDTHRVFQARAMLYAQRAVAQYGETPETRSLRAAAWSLNNFHRLAREEFAAIDMENAEPWIKLAKLYAEYDINGTAAALDAAKFKREKGLASLLHFMLLDYANETLPRGRQFGEKNVKNLPDCARFYQRVYALNTFNMIHAPDGLPFMFHLERRIVPAFRDMQELPSEVNEAVKWLSTTVGSPPASLLGRLFGGQPETKVFSQEDFFTDLALVLKTLSTTKPDNDSREPSLQTLATILRDEQFETVQEIGNGLNGRNGAAETVIEPAMPVLEDHPAFEFLTLNYRDHAARTSFWQRLLEKEKNIPYNLLSMKCYGMGDKKYEESTRRLYSPYYAACLFADMENIRDVMHYVNQTETSVANDKHYFVLDILQKLCPNNPRTVTIRIIRDSSLSLEDVEVLRKKFGEYSVVNNWGLTYYYKKHGLSDKLLECLLTEFDARPTYNVYDRIFNVYLNANELDKAVEISTKFMESPVSQEVLGHSDAAANIGRILLQQGKFKEAEPYFVIAGQSNSNRGRKHAGHYYEITGRFDLAEEQYTAGFRSYSDYDGPFDLWAFDYRIDGPNIRQTTDAVLERFTLSRSQDPEVSAANRMGNHQVIFPCYCMDLPYPEPLGTDPLYHQFCWYGNGLIGFLAWFEILEKPDLDKAERNRAYWVLRRLRGLHLSSSSKLDPETQQTIFPVFPKQVNVHASYQRLTAQDTHAGYFSIDKNKRMADSKLSDKRERTSDDVDAYDLIMKDKERLLDRQEPIRFIFSHSALREGWDNPNVFQICTLKQSGSDVRKRQEIGRGLRLSVNQNGERMDSEDVHDINVLTVIASESYDVFTKGLQTELAEAVADRPHKVTVDLFENKLICNLAGEKQTIDHDLAESIYEGLVKSDYIKKGVLTDKYYEDKKNGAVELAEEVNDYKESVIAILDSIYDSHALQPENARSKNVLLEIDKKKLNSAEFKALWSQINAKSAYTVKFDETELIEKAVAALDSELQVSKITIEMEEGHLTDIRSKAQLLDGSAFTHVANATHRTDVTASAAVKYDLVGKIVADTGLTRQTVVAILCKMNALTFGQFVNNPEEFIIRTANIINEQKATVIIEHISYNKLEEAYDSSIFTEPELKGKLGDNAMKTNKHLYDHVLYDSANEKNFAENIDTGNEVVVYVKLPKGFYISTPVGKYNPDWAIAFHEGKVKHIYFVAETKGSMSSMQLRKIEEAKIKCASKHFQSISTGNVVYAVVDSYDTLIKKVMK